MMIFKILYRLIRFWVRFIVSIFSIKKQIRTIKLVNQMTKEIKATYGDINYHAYQDYINSKQFKRAKKLNDLGI